MAKLRSCVLRLPHWLFGVTLVVAAAAIGQAIRLIQVGVGPPVLWIADIALIVAFLGTAVYWRLANP